MKIYFVMPSKGYYRGMVTTSPEKAYKYAAFPFRETDLLEIDFAPIKTTLIGPVAAMSYVLKNPADYLCFKPVYEGAPSDQWFQCVRKSDLPALAEGVECENFQESLFGPCIFIKRESAHEHAPNLQQ